MCWPGVGANEKPLRWLLPFVCCRKVFLTSHPLRKGKHCIQKVLLKARLPGRSQGKASPGRGFLKALAAFTRGKQGFRPFAKKCPSGVETGTLCKVGCKTRLSTKVRGETGETTFVVFSFLV